MSILAQQQEIAIQLIEKSANLPEMHINGEVDNPFHLNNKYPDERTYAWSNSSLTLDEDGIEQVNDSVLDIKVIG
tara:strand:+ start:234 stop:458 length:225 start_codon:yes stop_codon:yes gene_type:complete